jgi:hypothetical protein
MTRPAPIETYDEAQLLVVEIPRAAQCPHYAKGKRKVGHAACSVKRTKAAIAAGVDQKFRCTVCLAELRWDKDYSVYVSKYLIEEDPW